MRSAWFGIGLLAAISAASCVNRQFNSSAGQTNAAWEDDVGFLELFDRDSPRAMDLIPPKRDGEGNLVEEPLAHFSEQEIADRSFITKRDRTRARMCRTGPDGARVCLGQMPPGRARIETEDKVEDLVEAPQILANIQEMEARNLREAKLPTAPWSGDYWAIYQGLAAARYADARFMNQGTNWSKFRKYVLDNPVSAIVESGKKTLINKLSPTEKYDLLVGDSAGTLTNAMWAEGEYFWNENSGAVPDKRVETWMGICDGWSPAAYMMPRPGTAVTVNTPASSVTFYPTDLKALASLLWARSEYGARFIGLRCQAKNPQKDRSGRILDQACFDNNPGTWHKAIVNQIGLLRRGFVMDATYDYEVWNQPVYGYKYTYFNPQTKRAARSAQAATVPVEEFTTDKFKSFRAPRTKAVVGIKMMVTYTVEVGAAQTRTDSPDNDAVRQVEYHYDLELDSRGNIIGGEWYNNTHPDFAWTPPMGMIPESSYDRRVRETWQPSQPLPEALARAASRASVNSLPLTKIVYPLFEASARGGNNPPPVVVPPAPAGEPGNDTGNGGIAEPEGDAQGAVRFETSTQGNTASFPDARIPRNPGSPSATLSLDTGNRQVPSQGLQVEFSLDHSDHRTLQIQLRHGRPGEAGTRSVTLFDFGQLQGRGALSQVVALDAAAMETFRASRSTTWSLVVKTNNMARRGAIKKLAIDFR